MEWHDGLSIVSHSFKFSYHRKFAYQERVLKTFFARARKRFTSGDKQTYNDEET